MCSILEQQFILISIRSTAKTSVLPAIAQVSRVLAEDIVPSEERDQYPRNEVIESCLPYLSEPRRPTVCISATRISDDVMST